MIYNCTKCDTELESPDSELNKLVECPDCKNIMVSPLKEAEVQIPTKSMDLTPLLIEDMEREGKIKGIGYILLLVPLGMAIILSFIYMDGHIKQTGYLLPNMATYSFFPFACLAIFLLMLDFNKVTTWMAIGLGLMYMSVDNYSGGPILIWGFLAGFIVKRILRAVGLTYSPIGMIRDLIDYRERWDDLTAN